MTKEYLLDVIKLLSALEAWGFSNSHKLPDYLIEEIERLIEETTKEVLTECYDAMQDAAREEGGYIEWTPGMERPLPANAIADGQVAEDGPA